MNTGASDGLRADLPRGVSVFPREELITAAMEAHLTLMAAVEKHPDATLAYKAMIMEIAKVIQRATIIMEEEATRLSLPHWLFPYEGSNATSKEL